MYLSKKINILKRRIHKRLQPQVVIGDANTIQDINIVSRGYAEVPQLRSKSSANKNEALYYGLFSVFMKGFKHFLVSNLHLPYISLMDDTDSTVTEGLIALVHNIQEKALTKRHIAIIFQSSPLDSQENVRVKTIAKKLALVYLIKYSRKWIISSDVNQKAFHCSKVPLLQKIIRSI
jgi:hypothetical protein